MSDNFSNDEFDAVLSRAMRARPECRPVAGLAERAMQFARSGAAGESDVIGLLVRQRRMARLASCAAVLIIGVILSLGARRSMQIVRMWEADSQTSESMSAAQSQSSGSNSSATSSETSSTISPLQIATIGGCVFAVVLIFMALDRASRSKPTGDDSRHRPTGLPAEWRPGRWSGQQALLRGRRERRDAWKDLQVLRPLPSKERLLPARAAAE